MIDSDGRIHISLVTSKTKVAPIKRLTIPCLELCGAHLLAQLVHHVLNTFGLPLNCVYAWTDSTIVINWLVGNPRRFKTYVGNRVSHILELTFTWSMESRQWSWQPCRLRIQSCWEMGCVGRPEVVEVTLIGMAQTVVAPARGSIGIIFISLRSIWFLVLT